MRELIIATYVNLESFVEDIMRLEKLIEKWEGDHPGYEAEILSEVTDGLDEDELYKITVLCRRPSKE